MAIVRWNPVREMEALQERMSRLFGSGARRDFWDEGLFQSAWTPAVDIYEDTEAIKIHVEVPGMNKDEIDIQVHENTLTIKGERKFADEEKRDNYHRIERGYGTFVRAFALPNTVEKERVSAAYKDGVLTLTLPKAAEAKPKQIKIGIE